MNKHQLATKIWESANKMRSKIEANEYKDYILGFIFYKYLSDKEVKWLKDNDFTDNNIKSLTDFDTLQTGLTTNSSPSKKPCSKKCSSNFFNINRKASLP